MFRFYVVQRILLDNFKVITDDPATSLIFPRPPMVSFRRDDNLRTSLVHTAEKQAATRAGTYPCQHPRCRTCGHISSETDLLGPKDRLTIQDSFTCLSSGLIYCISCRRCPAIREFITHNTRILFHKAHLYKSIRFSFTCEKSLYSQSELRTAISHVK